MNDRFSVPRIPISSLKQVKYEPVEDLEFVKDKELNEKLAALLSNFWTLQWKAVSDAVEQSSRQCKYSSVCHRL